ncbi:Rho termination factor N-terminal domain-containing protein [Staphylococcus saprophyticus]|nr:Rho termination factor N-terminal domain-containing protein [Staphylococcus saprophyticus]MDW4448843.1 Rho termination factor N-terminal domain-containing protein [Staphylococcus saprophyticus]
MTNKVIKYFTDLQDNNHEYNEGDVFPREGKEVSEERLAELSTKNNRQGVPLIERVQEQINYNDMKVSELKEIAKEREIEGYSDMKKAELIEVLEGGK